MAIDQLGLFYSNAALTGATNSDIVPLTTTRQFGTGARPLYIDGRVTVIMANTGTDTTTITVQSSPYEAFNSSITNTVIATIASNAAVGTRIGPVVLPALAADKAFLRLASSVTGGNAVTGSVTMWLTPDPEIYTAQPVGWTGPNLS